MGLWRRLSSLRVHGTFQFRGLLRLGQLGSGSPQNPQTGMSALVCPAGVWSIGMKGSRRGLVTPTVAEPPGRLCSVSEKEALWTVQPPDAENRTSGGVGGCRGAIPGTRPDREPKESGDSRISPGSDPKVPYQGRLNRHPSRHQSAVPAGLTHLGRRTLARKRRAIFIYPFGITSSRISKLALVQGDIKFLTVRNLV